MTIAWGRKLNYNAQMVKQKCRGNPDWNEGHELDGAK